MIRIGNERELLPILRNPLADWEATQQVFIPLFESFVESSNDADAYNGWAFSLRFVKQSRLEYQDIVNSMDMSRAVNKDDWTFVPSTNNKNEWIWRNNNIVVVIHQESWLWFG